jgi:hypothetical protein
VELLGNYTSRSPLLKQQSSSHSLHIVNVSSRLMNLHMVRLDAYLNIGARTVECSIIDSPG